MARRHLEVAGSNPAPGIPIKGDSVEIVYDEEFQEQLHGIKEKTHKQRIKKILETVEKQGLKCLKYLRNGRKGYKIYEYKLHKPPYRLYFLYDEPEDTLYVMIWAHKKYQQKIINKLLGR